MTGKLKSAGELEVLRKKLQSGRDPDKIRVRICMTGCRAYGSAEIRDAFRAEIKKRKLGRTVEVVETGCHGFCSKAPAQIIDPLDIFYQQVSPADVPEIIESTIIGSGVVKRLVYTDPATGKPHPTSAQIPFFKAQERMVLRNCGRIDPREINQYIESNGYAALAKALKNMTPDKVIDELEAAGLRGRGGAGFPTFLKWRLAKKERADQKYIICNGDEGDPGAFMDRGVMEGDPHAVIEGMLIGGYAIGASRGYIYVRAEYPIAVEHLKLAIKQAENFGFLGKNILGTGFDFELTVKEGAGAFVCGEETALIASIEGKRGTPSPRPPFPTTAGLWGKPTCINNVETFANVTLIVLDGARVYRDFGTGKSRGTKIFSLAGKVNNTGLVEVPMGLPLRTLIYDIGGGITGNKKLKAVQMGGPSGGTVPVEHLDLPITYDSLAKVGAIMGSGGVIVLDENNCMVDIARYFLEFSAAESCGKCTPCRVGTKRMLETLTRMTKGEAVLDDIPVLSEAAEVIKDAALCGLGQNAPNPVLSTLRYFQEEFAEHIEQGVCRSFVCSELYTAPCVETCPVNTDARGYIAKISEGLYDEALEIAKARNPFPGICGRVCHHPCEGRCRRADIDSPVAIRSLKRFVADYELKANPSPKKARHPRFIRGKRAAVVGAGPSGLAAANELAGWGYRVTVFEADKKAGGAMQTGIPPYRLPREILAREVSDIKARGVVIKTNTRVGRDIRFSDLARDYDAVLLAVGANVNNKLNIPGENKQGVFYGLDFLRDVNLGKKIKIGRRVIVIGGGNVAIDSARTAKRLGARDVAILYRRSRGEMPADIDEVADAEAEGVTLDMLIAPERIGRVKDELMVSCLEVVLGEQDASGRRRPLPVEGSNFTVAADTVIIAAGYGPDKTILKHVGKNVFACGDLVHGTTSVIQAVASGLNAAEAIDAFLTGETVVPAYGAKDRGIGEPSERRWAGEDDYQASAEPRNTSKKLPERLLKTTFKEARGVFSEKQAISEAMRCLRCNQKEE
jgi:NADH-quinone oxidoreductase subunit F